MQGIRMDNTLNFKETADVYSYPEFVRSGHPSLHVVEEVSCEPNNAPSVHIKQSSPDTNYFHLSSIIDTGVCCAD